MGFEAKFLKYMKEEKIVINGLLINYHSSEKEEKTAKTVIFLHGWRADGKIWIPVIRDLETGGSYQIHAPDLPGFGNSEAPLNFYLSDYVELIKEFISKLNLQKIILVGHSFGGRIALKLAATYPYLLAKLVLVDSAGIRVEPRFRIMKNILAKLLKPLFLIPGMRKVRHKIYKQMGAEDYVATPELTRTYLNIINEDLTHELPKIKTPTLIFWGDKDQETSLKQGRLVNRLISDSKFIILKNAGHFSFVDNLEAFSKGLKNFLG